MFEYLVAWICLFDACQKVPKIVSQMVVNDGDESHGRIRKKSPEKKHTSS